MHTLATARNKRAELSKIWPMHTRRISIITAIALELLYKYNSIRYKYILYNLYISAVYANI
jgi:hypothetical protein